MALISTPPDAIRELPSHRTEFSKTFELPGNARRFIARQRRVHVPADIEKYKVGGFPSWEDVDLDFVLQGAVYGVGNAWYACSIERSRIAYTYTSKLEGHVEIELAKIDGQPLHFHALRFAPVVAGNKLTFPAFLPDLDLEFEARAEGLFVNKILHSDQAPRRFTWHIERDRDCPLKVNCETQGHDNHGELDSGRKNAKKGDKCRRIEMQHDVKEVAPGKLQTAQDFEEIWTGRTFYHDDERRLQPDDAKIYPVWIDQDITQPITATIDDGYTGGGFPTTWFYTQPTNFFGYYSLAAYSNGWRFAIGVPQGSTITLAELKVEVTSVVGAGNTLTLYAYDVDDAPQFASVTVLPTTVAPITTASVTQVLTAVGQVATNTTTIVQEIVNRAGWVTGNHISFVNRNPVTVGGTDGGYIEDYTNPGTNEPVLEITFTTPAVTNIVPRTMPAGWMRRF